MTPEAPGVLRTLAEVLPVATAVPVAQEWLLDLLASQSLPTAATPPMEPTVEPIAARCGRAPVTVRAWCEAGRVAGANKVHDGERRIPTASVEAFEAQQRQRECTFGRCDSSPRASGDGGEWAFREGSN